MLSTSVPGVIQFGGCPVLALAPSCAGVGNFHGVHYLVLGLPTAKVGIGDGLQQQAVGAIVPVACVRTAVTPWLLSFGSAPGRTAL